MNLNFVRATYWLVAIADVLAAIQLMMPTSSTMLGFHGLRAPGAAGKPATVAAVLFGGWAFVVVWAHLRTRQRRAVLSITFGITLALAGVNILFGLTGQVPWSQLVASIAIQLAFAVILGISMSIARRAAIATGVT